MIQQNIFYRHLARELCSDYGSAILQPVQRTFGLHILLSVLFFIHIFPSVQNNSTEQSPSWEADIRSASQEIIRLLSNSKVHYRFSKEPATIPYPKPDESRSQYHALHLRSVLILSSHIYLDSLNGIFLSGFPTKIFYKFLVLPVPAAYPVHVTLLNLTPNNVSWVA